MSVEANDMKQEQSVSVGEPAPVQSCFCHSGVSLQSVSGGASPDGYLGRLTLLIDDQRVEYVVARPAQQGSDK